MPHGRHGFGGGDGEDFLLVGVGGEDAAVAHDDADDEEGACQVAQEGQGPVLQHFEDRGAAVEGREGGVLIVENVLGSVLCNGE